MRTLVAAGAAFIVAITALSPVGASSHREAPLISQDPLADNTDVYAFVSPERPDRVVLIANFIPLQFPSSGPNFWRFDDNVLYEIMVDNTGDAVEDVTYQFRFTTTSATRTRSSTTPAQVTSIDDPDLNVRQFFSLTEVARPTPHRRRDAARRQTCTSCPPTSGSTRCRTTLAIGTGVPPAGDRRHPRLRRPARRGVLRRPRRHLRPAAAAQPGADDRQPDRQPGRASTSTPSRSRCRSRALTRNGSRPTRGHRSECHHRRLVHGQPPGDDDAHGGGPDAPRATGCRCRASAIRWSTRW